MNKGDNFEMKFLNHIFAKHPIPVASVVVSIIALVVYFVSSVFAAGPFAPGDELDPDCTPGTPNCVVNIFPDQAGYTYGDLLQTNGSEVSWARDAETQWTTTGSDIYYNAGNVGIGIASPTQKLHVSGNVRFSGALMPNNSAGTSGQVLTSAGAGLSPTWAAAGGGGGGWSLTGNSGLSDGTNFIGTTDDIPLNFRVNNQKSGRIGSGGQTSFGYLAASINTAINITAVGYQALQSNSTGNHNTATGYGALQSNTTGADNTANGYLALVNITGNSNNTAVGSMALRDNTASSNTAIGSSALLSNTSGASNTATGYAVLANNTIGGQNTANGYQPLLSNSTGSGNTAMGWSGLIFNTTGSNNTAIGYGAGVTSIPGNANVSGSNNTFIGYQSGPSTATQLTNAAAIGNNAVVGASNSLVLGAITGVNGGIDTNVGIRNSSPLSALQIGVPNNATFSYGQMDVESGAPGPGDCTASTAGRFVYDTGMNRFYICDESGGWLSTPMI